MLCDLVAGSKVYVVHPQMLQLEIILGLCVYVV